MSCFPMPSEWVIPMDFYIALAILLPAVFLFAYFFVFPDIQEKRRRKIEQQRKKSLFDSIDKGRGLRYLEGDLHNLTGEQLYEVKMENESRFRKNGGWESVIDNPDGEEASFFYRAEKHQGVYFLNSMKFSHLTNARPLLAISIYGAGITQNDLDMDDKVIFDLLLPHYRAIEQEYIRIKNEEGDHRDKLKHLTMNYITPLIRLALDLDASSLNSEEVGKNYDRLMREGRIDQLNAKMAELPAAKEHAQSI